VPQVIINSKEIPVYKKPDTSFSGYYSIDVLSNFPFTNTNLAPVLSHEVSIDDAVLNMIQRSHITSVIFRDENDRLYKLDMSIPYCSFREEYGTSFCFFGKYFLPKENAFLHFFSETTLSVIQSTSGLISMCSKVTSAFSNKVGYCGKVNGKLFLVNSIIISTSMDAAVTDTRQESIDHHSA
jgi:hypothetical protein